MKKFESEGMETLEAEYNYRISEDGENRVFAYKDKHIGIFIEASEEKIEAESKMVMFAAYGAKFITLEDRIKALKRLLASYKNFRENKDEVSELFESEPC